MRVTRLFPLFFLVFVALVPASANAQGNSENAHACQQGGYLTLTDAEGNGFRNAGQCVRYAARGGQLYPVASLHVVWPKPASRDNPQSIDGSLVGSGLQPGAPVYLGARSYAPLQWFTVAQDGTINEVLDTSRHLVCGYADPHLFTTTRLGDGIRTYEYPDPPCHRDEWL